MTAHGSCLHRESLSFPYRSPNLQGKTESVWSTGLLKTVNGYNILGSEVFRSYYWRHPFNLHLSHLIGYFRENNLRPFGMCVVFVDWHLLFSLALILCLSETIRNLLCQLFYTVMDIKQMWLLMHILSNQIYMYLYIVGFIKWHVLCKLYYVTVLNYMYKWTSSVHACINRAACLSKINLHLKGNLGCWRELILSCSK